MTLSQLAAEGRFAEFFGSDLVEFDKYQRTLGFWKIAGAILEQEISVKELAILKSYSNGVNAFIAQNKHRLPIQFALWVIPIRMDSQPISIIRLMAGIKSELNE